MSQLFVVESAKDIALTLVYAVNTTFGLAHQVYENIPGARLIYRYVKQSHQSDPIRTVLEGFLLMFLIWYFYHKKYRPGVTPIVLTEKEIEELCQEWDPEPLVPSLSDFEKEQLEKLPVQIGQAGVKVKLADGKERINVASFNFLGLMNREEIKEKAIKALRKYGVGTCGPPGFYGTIDVHMELEREIAKFFNVDAAIIYSHGFSTISSCIPAFCKRGDLIVADDGISLACQKGLDISRSQIHFFKHNDMKDLEKKLESIRVDDLKKKKPLNRKFILVEGLYVNSGEIARLPEVIELARKFKYRIILEESYSLGALGKTGRGVTEYYDIPAKEIDIISASMSNALGAAGGFVCGSDEVVEHQRLSGQAYVFSASMPAMLAVSAIEALRIIDGESSKLCQTLQDNVKTFHQVFSRNITAVRISSSEDSPIIHLRLKTLYSKREEEEKVLQDVVDSAMRDGVLCSRAKYSVMQELHAPKPSIRVALSAGLTKKEVEKAATSIREGFRRVIKQ